MIIFKTFWNVVKKYKGTVLLYTVMLIVFGGLNMTTNESSMDFVSSKPDVFIVNQDPGNKVTTNLIQYMKNHSCIISLNEGKDAIDDALFFRDVNYVIYIPKHYGQDVMNGLHPKIDVKTTGDYQASIAEMLLKRYVEVERFYQSRVKEEEKFIKTINQTLETQTKVDITSKLDTTELTSVSRYFSFASYSIMAVIIFVICLVLSSFKEENVQKRTMISSMNYKMYNKKLLIASFVYSFLVWVLFILLAIFMFKGTMFTIRGFIYMFGALVFTFCSLTLALFISTLIKSKEAINGIVNVIALGSAFLCGAFVPREFLPQSVLTLAHIFPSYYYIYSNDLLKTMETISIHTLKPVLFQYLMLLVFAFVFILCNNMISKYKQKLDRL